MRVRRDGGSGFRNVSMATLPMSYQIITLSSARPGITVSFAVSHLFLSELSPSRLGRGGESEVAEDLEDLVDLEGEKE